MNKKDTKVWKNGYAHTCTHIQIYVYAWCNRFIYFTYENLIR